MHMCVFLNEGAGGQGQRTLQAPHTMQWAVRQRNETSSSVPARPSIPAAVPATSTGNYFAK